MSDTAERFWRRVDKETVTGCWQWIGKVTGRGYGAFSYQCRNRAAHRMALILIGTEIPIGMVVDHKCRNKLCVNPAHLRIVTPRINTLENSIAVTAKNAARTICIHGHPLSGANLYITTVGYRRCRTCQRKLSLENKHRRYGRQATH